MVLSLKFIDISEDRFETLREQTEILSRKIGSFIKYLNITDLKGAKYKP